MMRRSLFRRLCVVLLCVMCASTVFTMDTDSAFAKKKDSDSKGRIIFIPHDNRPVSDYQTADTIRQLGYEVIVPPDDLLGGYENLGDSDKLWEWLEQETGGKKNSERKKGIKAVVMSGDSMIYGSLVASRKHDIPAGVLQERVDKFSEYHSKHPSVKTYVFSSIMRTPRNGEASGDEEPEYYQQYGADIFRYTELVDREESEGINKVEKKELEFLQELIPSKVLKDWMLRRNKNFAVTKAMIDLTKNSTFTYYALGRDDNAPYSQTHRENRKLSSYALGLGAGKFQNMAGIDEFGLLLLTRAVNDIEAIQPFVYVEYNKGVGAKTVPSYSDEEIDDSIRKHITCAGGVYVASPARADLVLLVNTRVNGRTGEANEPDNNGKINSDTRFFVDKVEKALYCGQPVAVADIAYANGSDNALMNEMQRRKLLFKLQSYAGWNTATNSAGFVLCQGMLAPRMSDDSKDRLLALRYLDDWAYQSNVRQKVARQIGWFRGEGYYSYLADKRDFVEYRTTKMIQQFADDNLPPIPGINNIQVTSPWNRMFEASIRF